MSPPRARARPSTGELRRKDRDHLVHPWQDFALIEKEGALVVAEGEGAVVRDAEGRPYLDGIGGMWCVNAGYGREEIVEAMAEQARRLPYYNVFADTTNPPAAELAERLAGLAPAHLNRVFYGSSGSAANDTAVRLIHYYWKRLGQPSRTKLISRHLAYHGTSYLTMTLTGRFDDHAGWQLAPDLVHYVSAPYVYRRPEGSSVEEFCDLLVEELEAKILELGPENVAAFFSEPIAGAGGVIVPPPGYHRRAEEVCRRYGVLTVSDEVVTGFGRLGYMLASEPAFGLAPDLITCAKGLSSGYAPLAATLLSDALFDVLRDAAREGFQLAHGYTWSGHPVCCAAALANIAILEREDLCGRVRDLGPYFEERLATLAGLPLVGDVRGSHFMLCVENVADKRTKALLPQEVDVGGRIAAHAQARGLLVRPIGHLNILSPPLVVTKEQIDEIVETLRAAILATADDLVRERIWRARD